LSTNVTFDNVAWPHACTTAAGPADATSLPSNRPADSVSGYAEWSSAVSALPTVDSALSYIHTRCTSPPRLTRSSGPLVVALTVFPPTVRSSTPASTSPTSENEPDGDAVVKYTPTRDRVASPPPDTRNEPLAMFSV
jgi:hypothetical protein